MDGTLADSVPADSHAKGKVRAKTGTLYYGDLLNWRSLLRSKALAGVLETKSGKTLTFALFVNDLPLAPGVQPSSQGKVLGKVCAAIFANVP